MYSPTNIVDPSPRAQALSQAVSGLVRERRTQDPGLAIPDALVALELAKMSLLEEAGVGPSSRRAVLAVALAISAAVVGLAFFVMGA